MSDWLKISIVAERGDSDRIEELFEAFHAESISVANADQYQEDEAFLLNPPLWSRQTITGLFSPTIDYDSLITAIEAMTVTEAKIEKTWLSNRDWVTSSQQTFTPVHYN